MPSKEFIEQYPLYKKFATHVPSTMDGLLKVAINMVCENCKSSQTFRMTNNYFELTNTSNERCAGAVVRASYVCSHCQSFSRVFFVQIDSELKWLMKVGQFPAWDIVGDANIERLLGKHSEYYKRGLICESQGYGIGAFGYYRRIVEEIIDGLLEEVSHLLAGPELAKYQEALEKTKKTTVTQEKIELVKDLLPPILRPDDMNPLAALHSALSEGLHAESDESCQSTPRPVGRY